MRITVSRDKRNFVANGNRFFLLGDTCWSGFTHPSDGEWDEYLSYRVEEGFNAIQINVLPQRHASKPYTYYHPFTLNEDGTYDFYHIVPEYFDHAKVLLKKMQTKGLIPMLVLLWGNYVPGTWQQKLDAGRKSVLERPFSMQMPFDAMQEYVRYAVDCFKEYEPIWIISGDTNLDNDEAVSYYQKALQIVKAEDPDGLTTLHLFPTADIPPALMNMEELAFYMFQPGHNSTQQYLNRALSRKFFELPVKRPAMNSETCYEANSFFDTAYGRFTERDVRKAFWQSVLNGACCGFTYGAAGIWLWQRRNVACSLETPLFPGEGKRWFDQAHDWRTDLELQGAWDVSWGKWIIETFGAWNMHPVDGIVMPSEPDVAVAMNDDETLIMLYMPCATRINLHCDLSDYCVQWIALENRKILAAQYCVRGAQTILQLPMHNSDYLLIAKKRNYEND